MNMGSGSSSGSPQDLWLRRTDKYGIVSVTYHRVWDKQLFIGNERAAAKRDGGSVVETTKPPAKSKRSKQVP